MTETLNRPSRSSVPPRRTPPAEPGRSALALGAGAGVWAAAVGLLAVAVPLLLLSAADSRSGTGWVEVVRSGGRFWLLAHGVTLDLPGGRFALTPLGLTLLPVALVARFASSAARDAVPPALRPAAVLGAAVAVPYAVLALLVAVACSGPDVHVSPVSSFVAGFAVAACGAAVGVLRPQRLWRAAWHALSPRTRRLAAGAGTVTGLLLGAGSLLVAVSLALHLSKATELAGAAEPGAAGGLALLLIGLSLVPNAAVWGASWLAGPGFAVGVGTEVSPFGHELGAVPALPLLAALPGGAVPEWVAVLVLALPLVCGAVAGRRLADSLEDVQSWQRTAAEAALVGPAAGLALGLLAWLSGGSAGGERLVEIGPSPVAVALAVTATVGVGAGASALVRRARLLSQPR